VEHKIQLLGSIFLEKIEFDGEKYRTNSCNKVLEWIFQNTNELQNKKTEEQDQKPLSSVSVQKTGINIDWHQGKGEDLPFEGESFDSVVLVDVLCSVEDVDIVLGEAYRVLKTGGKLYFLEHGISGDKKIMKWQIRLNGLNMVVACGCQLTRDIKKHLEDSKFKIDEMSDVPPFASMNVVYTHVMGIATKPH
jgi:SAM-dependent methyltransferase